MNCFFKKGFMFFIILILLGACATMSNFFADDKPDVDIEDFDIVGIDYNGITIKYNLNIENPYSAKIAVKKISSRLITGKQQLYKASENKKIIIPADDEVSTPFQIKIKYSDMMDKIKNYSEKEFISCDIESEVVIAIPKTDIPDAPPTYKASCSSFEKLPAIKPVLNVRNFIFRAPSKDEIIKSIKNSGKMIDILAMMRVVSALLNNNYEEAFKAISPNDLDIKFDISFVLEFKNLTKAQIKLENFNYIFNLNGDKLIEGITTDVKVTNNTSLLTVKNQISSKNLTKSIIKALKSKKGNYQLTGTMSIKLPMIVKFEPVQMSIEEKGIIKIK